MTPSSLRSWRLGASGLRNVSNRLHDLLITTAAAKIPRQVISDLLFRRLRALIQQGLGCENKSRGAIAALERAELHKSFLERMERIVLAQTFDGQNFAAVRVHSEDGTGAYRLTSEQQCAGAADLNVTAELGASQTELFAHHFKQSRARFDFEAVLPFIDS